MRRWRVIAGAAVVGLAAVGWWVQQARPADVTHGTVAERRCPVPRSGTEGLTERLCRAGFPSAATAGATGSLQHGSQGLVLDEPGQVVQNVVLTHSVRINAPRVTLRNVRIETRDFYGVLVAAPHILLEDVTVVGRSRTTMAGIAALDGGSFVARRVDVSGVEDGVRMGSRSVLEDSFVHDLAGGPTAHYDAVVAEHVRGWTIRSNTILNPHTQTSAISFGAGSSQGRVVRNAVAGGGYAMYAGPDAGRDIRVEDNVFLQSVSAKGGFYGPVAGWDSRNAWSGNTWAEGPLAGEDVTP